MNEKDKDNEKDLPQDNDSSLVKDNQTGADTEETTHELADNHDNTESSVQEQESVEQYDEATIHPEELEQLLASEEETSIVQPARSNGKAWMYVSLALALILIVVLVKPPFEGSTGKKVIGSVNGVAITKDQLYDAMVGLGGSQTMENLIQDELIKQEGDKAGVVITDEDVTKEVERIKQLFPSEAEFESTLQQRGMTIEDLTKQTPMQLRVRKILEPQANVTEKDVEDYFNKNKASFEQPEEVKASHILVATKEEAEAILKELKDGGDFAAIAKKQSTDTGTKDNGGDLGFFGKNQMDAAFEQAAFSLKVGETTTEPVKSQFGYHIIKVTDRKEAKPATFAEEKDNIMAQLVQTKVSELADAWLADVKKKAQITNSLATDSSTIGDTASLNNTNTSIKH